MMVFVKPPVRANVFGGAVYCSLSSCGSFSAGDGGHKNLTTFIIPSPKVALRLAYLETSRTTLGKSYSFLLSFYSFKKQ